MANWSIKKTEEREKRVRRLKDATGENTRSGALDVAMKHYLQDLENKERYIELLCDDAVDALSTPYVPMERDVEESVGRTND